MNHWPNRVHKTLAFLLPDNSISVRMVPTPWQDVRHSAPYYITRQRNGKACTVVSSAHRFDELGLPYFLSNGRRSYSPLLVARVAMEMLDGTSTAKEAWTGREAFLEALLQSAKGKAIWGNGTQSDRMRGHSPSAMIQGVVVSALLRLSSGNPDARTATVIDEALHWILLPVKSNGTISTLLGKPFLEEFPRNPAGHILNGCIYGLFGLFDAADCLDHSKARRAAVEVHDTLHHCIDLFIHASGWSYYALQVPNRPYWASVHYHCLHIAMLNLLVARRPSTQMAMAASRWQAALGSLRIRLASGVRKTTQVLWLRGFRRYPLREG